MAFLDLTGLSYFLVKLHNTFVSKKEHTNASLGQGCGICDTSKSSTSKIVSLENYTLALGGIVSVKFKEDVTAKSTMSINSKGAKPIYYKGAQITNNIIKAGDTATFIYDGSYYHLLTINTLIDRVVALETHAILDSNF